MSTRRWRGEGTGARPLIFAGQDVTRIVEGRKTQLRRLARTDSLTNRLKPCGLRVGSSHDIHTSMQSDPAARVTITAVEAQPLVAIPYADARAEGWRTRGQFAAAWMLRHDPDWPLLEEAPCPECDGFAEIEGERCDAGCDEVGIMMIEVDLTDDEILAVFHARHKERWVWAVTFELAQHLYLHKKTDGGYTANPADALLDAGEVLAAPRPDWAARAEVHRREALQDRDGHRLAGLATAEERLAELRRLATERDVDIDKDLHYIGHRIDRIEDKVRRAA